MGELRIAQRQYQVGGGRFNTTVKAYRIILYEILIAPNMWEQIMMEFIANNNQTWKSFPLRKNDERIRIWKEWIVSRGSTRGPDSQYGRAMDEAKELRSGGLFYIHLKLVTPGQIVDWRSDELKKFDRRLKAG